jgi:hypothetical protein
MSKINDSLERIINSQFIGELIYLKIAGNDSVGYISAIQYFNIDTLYEKNYNNGMQPDREVSYPGHLREEFKFFNKELLFKIEDKLISFTHSKEIQSLVLELFSENISCSITVDEIKYFLVEINEGNSTTYDFRKEN